MAEESRNVTVYGVGAIREIQFLCLHELEGNRSSPIEYYKEYNSMVKLINETIKKYEERFGEPRQSPNSRTACASLQVMYDLLVMMDYTINHLGYFRFIDETYGEIVRDINMYTTDALNNIIAKDMAYGYIQEEINKAMNEINKIEKYNQSLILSVTDRVAYSLLPKVHNQKSHAVINHIISMNRSYIDSFNMLVVSGKTSLMLLK